MDATKLIEEADRLAHELSTSRFRDRRYYSAQFSALAAALKASEERATAAELDAASLRAAWKIADRTSLTAECQAHAKTSFDLLGVVKERDALAAANLAANKRIVELEHELGEWMRRAQGWESEAAIATDRLPLPEVKP